MRKVREDFKPMSTPELEAKMEDSQSKYNQDLVRQLALVECGMSDIYPDDNQICQDFNISPRELEKRRLQMRPEIEDFKKQFRYGKKLVVDASIRRLEISKLLEEAAINGDERRLKELSKIMALLERNTPIRFLKSVQELLKDVQLTDSPNVGAGGAGPININISSSPAMSLAEEALRKRRERKAEPAALEDKKEEGV